MPTTSAIQLEAPQATTIDRETEIFELQRLLALPAATPLPLDVDSITGRVPITPAGLPVKRALDITISVLALIVLAPIMLMIALVVRLGSNGPAFFVQERVGQNGRVFRMYKFRSMHVGTAAQLATDELAHGAFVENGFKMAGDDPRITGIGRFIRLTSLDELPQLFNVLKGDMSLVGIRPIPAAELADRTNYDQECYRAMKPGMTGLWQVSGRSSLETRERHDLDRRYVETWTAWNDVKVLARTPLAVLKIADTR